MDRNGLLIVVVAIGIEWFGSGCLLAQGEQRKMTYSSSVPIAERLLPGDKEVLLYKDVQSPPYGTEPTMRETFEQEIKRLSLGEPTAVLRVVDVQGELADKGTWLQTKVNAEIEQLVKAPKNASGRSIELSFSGGRMRIGNTWVTTGAFPDYMPGERYLVFMVERPRVTPVLAFRVDQKGALHYMRMNNGAQQSFKTHLVGRNVSEVIQSMTRK